MVFFKENIRLVISFLFSFSITFQRAQVSFTHIQPTPYPSPPNSRFLYISSLHFLLWFLGSLIFGHLRGPFYFLVNLAMHLNRCFLHFTQTFWTLLYWEGFFGYLVYNIAKKGSLPNFLHFRVLLYSYAFLPLFLPLRSALNM